MAEQIADDKAEQARIDKERRAAYAEAQKVIRLAHPEEFLAAYEKACADRGVPFKRRLSAEERAREQIKALAAEYPSLVAEVIGS